MTAPGGLGVASVSQLQLGEHLEGWVATKVQYCVCLFLLMRRPVDLQSGSCAQ